MLVANYLSPKAILQADFIHFITFLMNLISQWNQSEFLSDHSHCQASQESCQKMIKRISNTVCLKTCKPGLNIILMLEMYNKNKFMEFSMWIKTYKEWNNIYIIIYFYGVNFPFNPGGRTGL